MNVKCFTLNNRFEQLDPILLADWVDVQNVITIEAATRVGDKVFIYPYTEISPDRMAEFHAKLTASFCDYFATYFGEPELAW